MRKIVLSAKQKKELIDLVLIGASSTNIAKYLGIGVATIYNNKEIASVYHQARGRFGKILQTELYRRAFNDKNVGAFIFLCKTNNIREKPLPEIALDESCDYKTNCKVLDHALALHSITIEDYEKISNVLSKRYELLNMVEEITELRKARDAREGSDIHSLNVINPHSTTIQ